MKHSNILFIFSFVLSVSTSLQSMAKELPLEDFVKHSDYLDIKISPDGKHIASRIRDDDVVYMLISRLSDGKVVGGIRPGKENEVNSVTWVNNERLIYTFAEKRSTFDAAVPTGELFAVNLDNSANKMLAGFRASDSQAGRKLKTRKNSYASHRLLNVLPGDDKRVLIVEYPWSQSGNSWYDRRERAPIVSHLNIYTGRKSRKETIPYAGARVFANDQGEVNFVTWSEDSIATQAAYRPSKKDPWQDISSALELNAHSLTPVSISDDGLKVYLTGPTGEQEIKSLFVLELNSKSITKVFDNEKELVYWKRDLKGEPLIGTSFPDYHSYHYSLLNSDSPLIKHHKALRNAFGGQEVQIQTYTHDGKLLVLFVDSDTNPGEYYLYNTDTRKADFLWANYSWIDPRTLAPMKAISLQARDGQTLNGYLTSPSNSVDKKALVVLPHGGPHGVRDYPFYDSEVQLLANRGYHVLQINFRGSGGYGERFERQGYKHWGKVMVDDVIDATRWVLEQGQIDKNAVCIYGGSYGGYSALMSAVKAPELFNCAIGNVGVYDLEAMKLKGDIPIGFRGRNYLDAVLGTDLADLKQQSPVNHASKIKAKVLLIHGDEDVRVPSYHSKKMRKALKKANNPAEWLYLHDAGHGAFSVENRTEVYETLLNFLEENIAN